MVARPSPRAGARRAGRPGTRARSSLWPWCSAENAFYPVFLLVALLLVRMVEQPTGWAQVVFLGGLVLALATRAQAIAIVPAALTAPLLWGSFTRTGFRASLLALPAHVSRRGRRRPRRRRRPGRSRPLAERLARRLCGRRRAVVRRGEGAALPPHTTSPRPISTWGVIPVAAAVVLVGRSRSLDRPLQAFLAVTLALTGWFAVVVATFEALPVCRSHPGAEPVRRRAAVRRAPPRGVGRARRSTTAPPRTCGCRRVGAPDPRDPVRDLHHHVVGLRHADAVALVGRRQQAGLVLGRPARAPALCGVRGCLAVLFRAAMRSASCRWSCSRTRGLGVQADLVGPYPYGVRQAGAGALFQGIRGVPRDWIDRSVPCRLGTLRSLWTGHSDRFTVNVNEFFNRRVGRVYYTNAPTPGGIARFPSRCDRTGAVTTAAGASVRLAYVLTDGSVEPNAVPSPATHSSG